VAGKIASSKSLDPRLEIAAMIRFFGLGRVNSAVQAHLLPMISIDGWSGQNYFTKKGRTELNARRKGTHESAERVAEAAASLAAPQRSRHQWLLSSHSDLWNGEKTKRKRKWAETWRNGMAIIT
jgi:hypothetical protein